MPDPPNRRSDPKAMPRLCVSYTLAQPNGAKLAVSLVDCATGNVWSPGAKAFVPASQSPPDGLYPLTNVGGPNHAGTYVGIIPTAPDLADNPTKVYAYVHPAAGGAPIDAPFPATADVVTVPPGMKLALILP